MAILKIYIANLGKYTEGELVGDWLELPADEDTIQDLYERIGLNDEYEECAIHDYKSDIEGLKVNEYDRIEDLNALAERLQDIDNIEVFEAILDYESDLESALDIYEGDEYAYYAGITNHEELGRYAVNEGLICEGIPDEWVSYLDYEAIGRDYDWGGAGGFYGNGFLEVY